VRAVAEITVLAGSIELLDVDITGTEIDVDVSADADAGVEDSDEGR
jgi:hypothetical protein